MGTTTDFSFRCSSHTTMYVASSCIFHQPYLNRYTITTEAECKFCFPIAYQLVPLRSFCKLKPIAHATARLFQNTISIRNLFQSFPGKASKTSDLHTQLTEHMHTQVTLTEGWGQKIYRNTNNKVGEKKKYGVSCSKCSSYTKQSNRCSVPGEMQTQI